LQPLLLGPVAGALGAGVFWVLGWVACALTGALASRAFDLGTRLLVAGVLAGAILGVWRSVDAWLTEPDAEWRPAEDEAPRPRRAAPKFLTRSRAASEAFAGNHRAPEHSARA
jgi:hypothetical protein